MRLILAFTLLAGLAALARTQPPPKDIDTTPQPRFGIPVKLKAYPQETAKKSLGSVVEAIEKGDTAYMIAHLLDPAFVELRISDRAKQLAPTVEVELATLRDLQIRNPESVRREDRLPTDRVLFDQLVAQRSRERAFRQLVRDMNDKMLNDPVAIKEIRKIFLHGTIADDLVGAKATHPDVKDRALYLKKLGDRWFLENRQDDVPMKEPAKDPEEKKQ
jgi:hypothetical protein